MTNSKEATPRARTSRLSMSFSGLPATGMLGTSLQNSAGTQCSAPSTFGPSPAWPSAQARESQTTGKFLHEFREGGCGGARHQVSRVLVNAGVRREEEGPGSRCGHPSPACVASKRPGPLIVQPRTGTTGPGRLRGERIQTERSVCHEAFWDWWFPTPSGFSSLAYTLRIQKSKPQAPFSLGDLEA